MNKVRKWIRKNVLKRETLLYRVYWEYDSPQVNRPYKFYVEVFAKGKPEARDKVHEYLLINAQASDNFKFLKVEER